MVVAARRLERQEQRLGHRPARQQEPLAHLEIVEPPLLRHHPMRCRVELAHTAPHRTQRRDFRRRVAQFPQHCVSVFAQPGTSPIAASTSVKVNGGSRPRTFPPGVFHLPPPVARR